MLRVVSGSKRLTMGGLGIEVVNPCVEKRGDPETFVCLLGGVLGDL